MLIPLPALDPTKLKARQFARSAAPAKKVDNSLWTETPAERQQRLADEVSGKKRRAANAPEEVVDPDIIKRRKLDEEIRRGVEEHTVRRPSPYYIVILSNLACLPAQNTQLHPSRPAQNLRVIFQRSKIRGHLGQGPRHGARGPAHGREDAQQDRAGCKGARGPIWYREGRWVFVREQVWLLAWTMVNKKLDDVYIYLIALLFCFKLAAICAFPLLWCYNTRIL